MVQKLSSRHRVLTDVLWSDRPPPGWASQLPLKGLASPPITSSVLVLRCQKGSGSPNKRSDSRLKVLISSEVRRSLL